MELKDYITIIGVALTFFVSVGSLIVSIKNTNKVAFINSITSARVKWIDELRQDISRFCGLITHHDLEDLSESQSQPLRQEIDILAYQIELKLNPNSKIDESIIDCILKILAKLDEDKPIENNEYNTLINRTQDLLKMEWERVKKESKFGWRNR